MPVYFLGGQQPFCHGIKIFVSWKHIYFKETTCIYIYVAVKKMEIIFGWEPGCNEQHKRNGSIKKGEGNTELSNTGWNTVLNICEEVR